MNHHHIIYGAYSNFQYRIIRVIDLLQWDFSAEALAAAPTYANTANAVSRDAYVAGFPISLPSGLPGGEYDLLIYDAASPANTDNPSLGRRITWNGNQITSIREV
jgi:hypothetical protein